MAGRAGHCAESPLNAQTIYSTAFKHYKKGNYAAALELLNKLMEVEKGAKIYALLGKVLVQLGLKSDAAWAYHLAGQEEGPRSDEYLAEAMKLHFACGNEDEALSLGMPLFQKMHRDPDIAFVVASILVKRGQRDLLKTLMPVLAESDRLIHRILAARLLTRAEFKWDSRIAKTLYRKDPHRKDFRSTYHLFTCQVNNYPEMERLQRQMRREIEAGDLSFLKYEPPYYNLLWCSDEALNRLAWGFDPAVGIGPVGPERAQARRKAPHVWGDKLHIGYLSSDFSDHHATMKLLQGVIESHDASRFDITLFCCTPEHLMAKDKGGRYRWGRILRLNGLTDQEAAATIRSENIDILVDLKGHTEGSRSGILNHGAAPVQVAWLGFPGTTAGIDLDYIIGDPHVLPDGSEPHYFEKFCRLPETYQPNDPWHRPRPSGITRNEVGLPEDRFVFASFNANRKISLKTIDLWASILRLTPDSLLWVLCLDEEAQTNIRRKLESAGIEASRVAFCEKVAYEEHINRLPLADLGLDTFPYNGHTTTSEQLWAGLPVLAMDGTNFASRVSKSLLNAIGLPELVTRDPDHYVETAVALYQDRERLAQYRQQLEENRFRMPLFDAERFCRHLERAYEMMADRARQGLEPDHIDVPALPARTGAFV